VQCDPLIVIQAAGQIRQKDEVRFGDAEFQQRVLKVQLRVVGGTRSLLARASAGFAENTILTIWGRILKLPHFSLESICRRRRHFGAA
jgi:endo-1,4-beta-D-glucanase Y